MKNLLKKLRQSRGETLIETLVAVLVMTCASVLLATMLLAASNLNGKALEQDQIFNNQLTAAETSKTPLADVDVQFATEKGTVVATIKSSLYGSIDGLKAYRGGPRAS
ncbi:MAG: hypothetical protein RRY64_09105 [Oscillospiraceae bacterium]